MTTQQDTTADRIRAGVAEDYATKANGVGCGRAAPSGGAAKYRPEEVAALPPEALEASFGCGNPLAFAGVEPGHTVVDLGCGAGADLLLAAERVGAAGRVIGIDMTDAMLERARANVAKAGATNVELKSGLIEALPVDASSVDWVISNCVVNLSPEKPRVFREVARVLRPGGRMLISDIVVERVPAWVRAVVGKFNPAVAGAVGEGEYVAGLQRAGLADVEVRSRYRYDADQIEGMLRSELSAIGDRSRVARFAPKLFDGALRLLAARIARVVAGRVTSIQVYARKSS
jgi:SAM-dependent methyltransferase